MLYSWDLAFLLCALVCMLQLSAHVILFCAFAWALGNFCMYVVSQTENNVFSCHTLLCAFVFILHVCALALLLCVFACMLYSCAFVILFCAFVWELGNLCMYVVLQTENNVFSCHTLLCAFVFILHTHALALLLCALAYMLYSCALSCCLPFTFSFCVMLLL